MDEYALERDPELRELRRPRVLVFAVDDALFSVHLAGVETVYDASAADLYSVKTRGGTWFDFLLHYGEPAVVTDLRDLFGLADVLGECDRSAFVVLRSRDLLVALGVDQCIGVRELDLGQRRPVPTALERENGLCVGHVVLLDGAVLTILDPEQLLGSDQRRAVAEGMKAARLFQQREARIDELWDAIRSGPTVSDVRAYARLCRRNGHTRTAAAARQVLRLLAEEEGTGDGAQGRSVGERLAAGMLSAQRSGQSADLAVFGPDGGELGRVFVRDGQIAGAVAGDDWGEAAVRLLLAQREGDLRIEPSDRPVGQVISGSAEALLITCFEALHEERKGRAR